MKTIEVSAAIIIHQGKIFVTQRGYGDFKDMWEFPGGKLEIGEEPEKALVREIKEELDSDIKIEHYLSTIEYSYPSFHLVMHNYICSLISGHLTLLEHEAAKFINEKELDNIQFLPADILVVKDLKKYLDK